MSDPRLTDPKFQQALMKQLAGGSPLERRVAHQFLQKNKMDVGKTAEQARQIAAQPPQTKEQIR